MERLSTFNVFICNDKIEKKNQTNKQTVGKLVFAVDLPRRATVAN